MKASMRYKKMVNGVSFMPPSLIYTQPDGVTLQTPIKMPQNLDESLTIALFGLNHPIPTQQRSYPSRKVQTFPMLTGSGYPQPLANASPSADAG
jgi:hypothetical protein